MNIGCPAASQRKITASLSATNTRTVQKHIKNDVRIQKDAHSASFGDAILRRAVFHSRAVHSFTGIQTPTALGGPQPFPCFPRERQNTFRPARLNHKRRAAHGDQVQRVALLHVEVGQSISRNTAGKCHWGEPNPGKPLPPIETRPRAATLSKWTPWSRYLHDQPGRVNDAASHFYPRRSRNPCSCSGNSICQWRWFWIAGETGGSCYQLSTKNHQPIRPTAAKRSAERPGRCGAKFPPEEPQNHFGGATTKETFVQRAHAVESICQTEGVEVSRKPPAAPVFR